MTTSCHKPTCRQQLCTIKEEGLTSGQKPIRRTPQSTMPEATSSKNPAGGRLQAVGPSSESTQVTLTENMASNAAKAMMSGSPVGSAPGQSKTPTSTTKLVTVVQESTREVLVKNVEFAVVQNPVGVESVKSTQEEPMTSCNKDTPSLHHRMFQNQQAP